MKKKAGILIYTCFFVFAAFVPAIAEYRLPDTGHTNSSDTDGSIITCPNTDQRLYVQVNLDKEPENASFLIGIGTQKWPFQTGGKTDYFRATGTKGATAGVDSSPAIGSDGTIFVGSDNNKLYAINPDFTQKWAFQTGDDVKSSPAIGSDGTIYVALSDDKIYAIEGTSGGLADYPWPMFHHDFKHTGSLVPEPPEGYVLTWGFGSGRCSSLLGWRSLTSGGRREGRTCQRPEIGQYGDTCMLTRMIFHSAV